ncbi:MAG: hypothetical protein HYR98_07460 [Nitrospirae bacterium]|nr:hypothetical protein [Nitrospirota bacterium]
MTEGKGFFWSVAALLRPPGAEKAAQVWKDPVVFLRFSPYWEVQVGEGPAPARPTNLPYGRPTGRIVPYADFEPWDFSASSSERGSEVEAAWTWEGVPWRRVLLRAEPRGGETALTVTVEFPEEPDAALLLHWQAWFRSLREYLRLYERGGVWNRLWRVVMERLWLTMTPSQRQQAVLILKITALEFVLFLAAVVIFLIAWRG